MDFGLYVEFASREGVSQHEVFRESFALVDEAERLGVDSMWLAEYHFMAGRSVLSAPVPIACAIASRTKRARVGLAVLLLPLGNPIRLAEEVATLDHISQGRLEFGIGRGTFPNIHEGFRVPFTESRRRFEEYLDIILKAWTTGGARRPQTLSNTVSPYLRRHHLGGNLLHHREEGVCDYDQPLPGVCPL